MFPLKTNSVEKILSHALTNVSLSTPSTLSTDSSTNAKTEPDLIGNTLKSKGYTDFKQLSEALQGPIIEAKRHGSMSIIKVASKSLHNRRISSIYYKGVKIEENIIKEAAILKYLTRNNPPPSLAKYLRFFDDENHFFLVMQHGGQNMFDFVKDCHQYIESGLIEIYEWFSFCKKAMKQMVDLIEWLHCTMNCCHLDISLENFVVSNVHVDVGNDGKKIVKIHDDFQIKIIDFGVSEVFTARKNSGIVDFSCSKFVGKTGYKSPEVFSKQQIFDARSADCWSLGVTFFMMLIGAQPFQSASSNDISFCLIMKGQMMDILYDWDRVHFVTSDIVNLLCRIFVEEKYRLDIKGIQRLLV